MVFAPGGWQIHWVRRGYLDEGIGLEDSAGENGGGEVVLGLNVQEAQLALFVFVREDQGACAEVPVNGSDGFLPQPGLR